MKCEACGKPDPDVFSLIGLPNKDGRVNSLVCEDCAKKLGWICHKHNRLHFGFADGSHLCLECVNDMAKEYATKYPWLLRHLEKVLPNKEFTSLISYLRACSRITLQPIELCLARSLSVFALRQDISFQKAIAKIVAHDSVDPLLPSIVKTPD
jgi:hypothetical protein